MTNNYTIRFAYEADASGITNLILSTSLACCFGSAMPCPDWYEESVNADQILRLIQSKEMTWMLAVYENKVAGVLAIQADTHVKYFFVKPEHHRQGIGKSLWAFALKAIALGESLSVRSSLFAVPAYKCLGFINTGTQQEFKGMHFQAMSAQLSVLRCRL